MADRRKPNSLAEIFHLQRLGFTCGVCYGQRKPCSNCEGTRIEPEHWPITNHYHSPELELELGEEQ